MRGTRDRGDRREEVKLSGHQRGSSQARLCRIAVLPLLLHLFLESTIHTVLGSRERAKMSTQDSCRRRRRPFCFSCDSHSSTRSLRESSPLEQTDKQQTETDRNRDESCLIRVKTEKLCQAKADARRRGLVVRSSTEVDPAMVMDTSSSSSRPPALRQRVKSQTLVADPC